MPSRGASPPLAEGHTAALPSWILGGALGPPRPRARPTSLPRPPSPTSHQSLQGNDKAWPLAVHPQGTAASELVINGPAWRVGRKGPAPLGGSPWAAGPAPFGPLHRQSGARLPVPRRRLTLWISGTNLSGEPGGPSSRSHMWKKGQAGASLPRSGRPRASAAHVPRASPPAPPIPPASAEGGRLPLLLTPRQRRESPVGSVLGVGASAAGRSRPSWPTPRPARGPRGIDLLNLLLPHPLPDSSGANGRTRGAWVPPTVDRPA